MQAPKPALRTVHKCVADGHVSYSDDPQCGGRAQALRIDMGANLMAPLPQQTRAVPAAPPLPPGGAVALSRVATPSPVVTAPACEALAREIENIDAQARQGQSSHSQQALRERRHAVRNRQLQLGCL